MADTLEMALAELSENTAVNSVLTIDAETRTILVTSKELVFGVESDQDAERKYFKVNRYVDNGLDLYNMSLRINYRNAKGETDQYIVTDKVLYGDYIIFSWVLSRKVTKYKGDIYFIVCAVITDSNGAITNEWNTTLATGKVLEGLEAKQVITPAVYDLAEQLMGLIQEEADKAISEMKELSNIIFSDLEEGETFTVLTSSTPEEEKTLLYNWDFTSSLVDTVSNQTASTTECSISEQGLVINASGDSCYLGSIFDVGRTLEIDVASATADFDTSSHGRCFMIYSPDVNKSEGLVWRHQTQAWAFYVDGSWDSNLPITDRDYFTGKTVKFISDSEGYISLYVGEEYIGKSTLKFDSTKTEVCLGGYSGSFYDMVISAVRVYG